MFPADSPFFLSCWDLHHIFDLIALKFASKYSWANYERMLKMAVKNHGWDNIEALVLR